MSSTSVETEEDTNNNSQLLSYILIGATFAIVVAVLIWRFCTYREWQRKNQEDLELAVQMHLQNLEQEEANNPGGGEEIISENNSQNSENQPPPLTHEEIKRNLKILIKENFKIQKFKEKLATYNSNCSICLEDFTTKDINVAMSKCNHLFHFRCIVKWILKRIGSADVLCPNCNFLLIKHEDILKRNLVLSSTNIRTNASTGRNLNSNNEEVAVHRNLAELTNNPDDIPEIASGSANRSANSTRRANNIINDNESDNNSQNQNHIEGDVITVTRRLMRTDRNSRV